MDVSGIWHGAMYGLGVFTFCNGTGWILWRLARCAWSSYRRYCREADAAEATAAEAADAAAGPTVASENESPV